MLGQWHGVQAYFLNASHLCFRLRISRRWRVGRHDCFVLVLNVEPEVSVLELGISRVGQCKGLPFNTCQKGSSLQAAYDGRHLITPGTPCLWGISFNFLGEMYLGGQEHFYLETHCTVAVPKGEDGEMELFVSTQNLMKTQVLSH